MPDSVVRRADQIELVDMTPEALRRRMAHGNIYPADKIDVALATTSVPGISAALGSSRCSGSPTGSTRISALTASAHSITEPWETRERVLRRDLPAHPRAITSSAAPPAWPQRSRRAPRRARADRSTATAVHGPSRGPRASSQASSQELGRPVPRGDRPDVGQLPSSSFAGAENATQLVLGTSQPLPLGGDRSAGRSSTA